MTTSNRADRPGDDRAQVPSQKQGGLHAAAAVHQGEGQPALAGADDAGCLLVGLAWIALFYVTGGSSPLQSALGDWNLVVGFGFIIAGVVLATKWR